MSTKAPRYLKRPEDFSYHVEALESSDLTALETFLTDMRTDGGLWQRVKQLLEAADDIGYTFLIAKDGFTKQLTGFLTTVLLNDTGLWRVEMIVIHPDHVKRGLARIMLSDLETRCKERFGKLRGITCAFDGKIRSLRKESWAHVANLQVLRRSRWQCQFSRKKAAQTEVIVSTAPKALEAGWKVVPYADTLTMGEECITSDLTHTSNKYIVLRAASSVQDYILFRIIKDTIVLYDFHFSSEAYRRSLMAFLDNEVVSKGFGKLMAYAPTGSHHLEELKRMGFWRNPFSFGGYNATFAILAKNLNTEESSLRFAPFHFNHHLIGEFLAEN